MQDIRRGDRVFARNSLLGLFRGTVEKVVFWKQDPRPVWIHVQPDDGDSIAWVLPEKCKVIEQNQGELATAASAR